MNNQIYKFGDFKLAPKQRKLFFRNVPVEISAKAFEILRLLIERQGEVVEKDEFLQKIWSDSFVEEGNLAVHIYALRRTLGDRRGEKKFIETVSGRGYCFVAPVKKESPESEVEDSSFDISKISDDFKRANFSESEELTSIAVLPLICEKSDDDTEYLATGITESLIENLSQIPGLRIPAYSAVRNYKKIPLDLEETGFLLGVEKILTGSISLYKNNVEINVELINSADKRRLWGTKFNGNFADIFQIREEITLKIVDRLQIRLNQFERDRLVKQPTSNSEAYKSYLKGKFVYDNNSNSKFNKDSLNSALRLFREAGKLDPNFAPTYIEIGKVYVYLFNINQLDRAEAYEKSKTALQMALALEENSSEAYVLQGLIQIFFEQKLPAAKKSLKRAVELNPNNAAAYHTLSLLTAYSGDFRKAIALENQALQFDPTSTAFNCGLLNRVYWTEDYGKAIVLAEEFLELDKNSSPALMLLALSYAHLKVYDRALKTIQKSYDCNPLLSILSMKAYIQALSGDTKSARKLLEEILAETDKQSTDFSVIGLIYKALGDDDKAIDFIEKECRKLAPYVYYMRIDPDLKSLHSHPRFQNLLQKYNFD